MGGHNVKAKRKLEPLIAGAARPGAGRIDQAFVAALDEDEALYFAAKLRSRFAASGQLWVVNLFSQSLIEGLLGLGYRDARMSAIDGGITLTGFTFQSPTT